MAGDLSRGLQAVVKGGTENENPNTKSGTWKPKYKGQQEGEGEPLRITVTPRTTPDGGDRIPDDAR
jgi:hypothetical protein